MLGFRLFFTRRPAGIALGGLAIGWAVLTREGAAAALPAAALALLVLARDRRERLAFAGYGMLGAALPISLLLWYNAYRFGHPLRHGYEGEGFTASLLEGVAGLLFSPGRGLLYAPAVLLALPGARLLWRRDRALILTAGTLFAGYLLMYGRWWAWDGGWAWGPRFLVPTLPFLLLLAGEAMTQPAGRRAALALGLLGFLAQLPGVFIDHQKFHTELFVERGLPYAPTSGSGRSSLPSWASGATCGMGATGRWPSTAWKHRGSHLPSPGASGSGSPPYWPSGCGASAGRFPRCRVSGSQPDGPPRSPSCSCSPASP